MLYITCGSMAYNNVLPIKTVGWTEHSFKEHELTRELRVVSSTKETESHPAWEP